MATTKITPADGFSCPAHRGFVKVGDQLAGKTGSLAVAGLLEHVQGSFEVSARLVRQSASLGSNRQVEQAIAFPAPVAE